MKKSILLFIVLFCTSILNAVVFSGKVTDESGNPIAGANVHVEGNGQNYTTEDDGTWYTNLGSEPESFVISKDGYTSVELNEQKGGENIDVTLQSTGSSTTQPSTSPAFSGKVTDVNGQVLSGVQVLDVNNNTTTTTDATGEWSMNSASSTATLVFHKEGYTYEQVVDQAIGNNINITLREAIKSNATLREEGYIKNGCDTKSIPDDDFWNVGFKITNLKGDLAPDVSYIRRDPSAVINVNGTYYMWYSYSKSKSTDESLNDAETNSKNAPWDLNDLYYATSKDGITWDEKGAAVVRGAEGSYDHRSVFTVEILQVDNKYYLVYQCAADEDGIYNRNTVGMSWADSPNGPWTKLDAPVLHPTYTNDIFFDNNAVHDPCIIPFKGKYYLYYKGECNCRNNQGCKNWCNPICGLNKQVKWGVAISDNPTGPFVKSQYNPITNTGHEIMAWPYADGMAILQHQDGPEALTIQYAEDGMNFDIMGNVTDGFPEAAGLGRAEKSNTNPHAGIKWGVGHQLNWGNNTNGGWMYIYRFDKVGTDVNGSVFSGKVTDSANQPLSGVSISVNGNSQTTTTDDQGEWSIALGSNKATLIFNKEGYEEGTLNNKNAGNNLNISLTKEAEPIIFSGKITDVNGQVLSGVQVLDVNNNTTTTTDAAGAWSMSLGTSEKATLVFHKEGFTYEQVVNYEAGSDINITLREAIKSNATLRNEYYAEYGCNTVSIPNDKNWNVEFEITELKGDLAPNYKYIRRDPSAVLTVGDTYYIWYSYSKSKSDDGSFNNDAEINSKKASWDLNDLYYATSTDGITWKEKGAAVVRGAAGSYDHRSVFTCEILQDNGKYYLVYQCAADEDGIYNRNTVGMSWANSPDGPWIKLDEPVLYPTYTNDIFFDNNAVHDPCIIPYKGKYYLYYKGECNCRDNQGCKNWCNPICDLSKQVKWGVAISDNPTGPFVKSQYNPITNTGHEVSVWPFASGMVILQHKDGPEPNTIQYAPDGMNFDIMGKVETFAVQWEGLFNGFPEAAGLARTTKSNTNPHADIKWGVGHQLNWGNNTDGGWMYIYRFDKKSADTSVDMDVTTGSQEDAASQSSIEIFPNPADNTLNIEGEFNSWEINSMEGVFFKSGSEKTIDISALPEALYVISFDGINSKVFSKK